MNKQQKSTPSTGLLADSDKPAGAMCMQYGQHLLDLECTHHIQAWTALQLVIRLTQTLLRLGCVALGAKRNTEAMR